MRRILKRSVRKDQHGRVLAVTTERLVDAGDGRLYLTTSNTFVECGGCGRVVSDAGELRGLCQYCGVNQTCVHCLTKCAACQRNLCGICARGFPGQSPLSVCPSCLANLRERQALQDRLLQEKAAFERQVVLQREWIRLLQGGALKRLPGGRAISTLGQLAVMRKLKTLERSLERGRRNGQLYLR